MKIINRSFTGFAVAGSLLASTVSASASPMPTTLIQDMLPDPGPETTFGDEEVLGAEFTVDSPMALEASALGFLDVDGDGLDASHEVGLWDSNGTLLSSVTINPSDSEQFSDDGFVFRSLSSPVLLDSGQNYVVGATFGFVDPDALSFDLTPGASYGNEVSWVQGRSLLNDGSLQFPSADFLPIDGGYVAGNVQFTTVPEPSSFAILAGLFGFGLAIYRRRRNLR